MKKYYSTICLITRDENEYLQEWIRHHIQIGFDHIYIYDHNNKEAIQETISKKLTKKEREYITIIPWNGKHRHAQGDAYEHCLAYFKKEAEWIAFIDTDEFIILHNNICINDFLHDYEQENIGGIYMNWVMFNANGHVNKSYEPVIQRFTCQCPDFQQYGKTIVRSDYVTKQYIHETDYISGYNTVDEDKNIVIGRRHQYHINKIQLNHYYTKSWEEWKRKISRGVADPYFGRNLREFFLYNPDMKYLDDGTEQFQEYERNVK